MVQKFVAWSFHYDDETDRRISDDGNRKKISDDGPFLFRFVRKWCYLSIYLMMGSPPTNSLLIWSSAQIGSVSIRPDNRNSCWVFLLLVISLRTHHFSPTNSLLISPAHIIFLQAAAERAPKRACLASREDNTVHLVEAARRNTCTVGWGLPAPCNNMVHARQGTSLWTKLRNVATAKTKSDICVRTARF